MAQYSYIPQTVSFSHFKVLRRVITHRWSGVLLFQTTKDIEGQLFFKHGEVYCGHKDDDNLLLFLSKTMILTEWKHGELQIDVCTTEQILLSVINQITWQTESQHAMINMFSTLPNIYADDSKAQFDNFLMNISHDIFHQMSSNTKGIAPSVYLLQHDPSNSLQTYRLKIFIFNYILGFIHAVKPNQRKQALVQKRLGILERIKVKVLTLRSVRL